MKPPKLESTDAPTADQFTPEGLPLVPAALKVTPLRVTAEAEPKFLPTSSVPSGRMKLSMALLWRMMGVFKAADADGAMIRSSRVEAAPARNRRRFTGGEECCRKGNFIGFVGRSFIG